MSSAPTLFISDLHLDASRPETTALFFDFLARRARMVRLDTDDILNLLVGRWGC